MKIEELRERISKIDRHFAESSLFKFYFLREIPREVINAGLSSEDRIRQGKDRVLIETLRTGTLGLPTTASPVFRSSLSPVPILHPSVLILTKLQRWCSSYTSTRPKTRTKSTSDKADIDYIIEWLRENKILIAFDLYSGRNRKDLLKLVRIYWDKKLYDGDEEFSDVVKEVLADDDLDDIIKSREEEGNLAEKALNVDDAPPIEGLMSGLTQEFSDMGKEVLVDIKDIVKSQKEGHFVGEALAIPELAENLSDVAEEVLTDGNPKDTMKSKGEGDNTG